VLVLLDGELWAMSDKGLTTCLLCSPSARGGYEVVDIPDVSNFEEILTDEESQPEDAGNIDAGAYRAID